MLFGKSVVLGVSGGIACYKACEIVSRLKKLGADVDVIMTEHACEFVAPLTFQTLAKSKVVVDQFEKVDEWDIKHISLAKKADLMLVAPATANVIANFANGIASDALSTTYLACNAKKLICPAMNTAMYLDEATQKNMATLKDRGVEFCEANDGLLACGDVGKGRLAEPCDIVKKVVEMLTPSQDLHGKTVLINAGGTEQPIDPVRVITNRSSGKMGKALAIECMDRGAKVIFVHGNISVDSPHGVEEIAVKTTGEMYDACVRAFKESDMAILAAAPCDYEVKSVSTEKLKDESLTLRLVKTQDIAKALGKEKEHRKLIIFAAETQNLQSNALKKLKDKNADMVVANDVSKSDAGFDVDYLNAALIRENETEVLNKVLKSDLAKKIIDKALTL